VTNLTRRIIRWQATAGLPHSVQWHQRDPQLVYTRSEWKIAEFISWLEPARVKQVLTKTRLAAASS